MHKKTMLEDVAEFTKLKQQHMGGEPRTKLNVEWITQMVMDELQELKEASTEAGQVDALLDTVYYIFDCLNQTGLPIQQIWDLIQAANMSKFTLPGGFMITEGPRKGKWEKPPGFVSPDAQIEKLVRLHRDVEGSRTSTVPLTVDGFMRAYDSRSIGLHPGLHPEQKKFLALFCEWAATRKADNKYAAATELVFYSLGQRQGTTTLLKWMQDVWHDRIHVIFDWRQPVSDLYNPAKPRLLIIDSGTWVPLGTRKKLINTFYPFDQIPNEGGVFCT